MCVCVCVCVFWKIRNEVLKTNSLTRTYRQLMKLLCMEQKNIIHNNLYDNINVPFDLG